MEKLAPVEKVFEAFTALDSGRVEILRDDGTRGEASVWSSDHAKCYTVRWDGDLVYSDDNSTYWRGYAGYPVIAVLMKRGVIKYDADVASEFSGVNWKELNTRHRNDYAKAVADVIEERHINSSRAYDAANNVIEQLAGLPIEITRKRLKNTDKITK